MAVARGGCIPAVIAAEMLSVTNLRTVTIYYSSKTQGQITAISTFESDKRWFKCGSYTVYVIRMLFQIIQLKGHRSSDGDTLVSLGSVEKTKLSSPEPPGRNRTA